VIISVEGGDKLQGILARISDGLGAGDTLRIGFLEGSTYPDGTSVPEVATIQEFGGVAVRQATTVSVYRMIDSEGEFKKGARFVKRGKSNYKTQHKSPMYQITIPSRPFFRTMIKEHTAEWGPVIGKMMVDTNYDQNKLYKSVGELIKGQLQDSIIKMDFPPNAPSTIRRKGFNNPLIDTGHMLNSVDYEVVK